MDTGGEVSLCEHPARASLIFWVLSDGHILHAVHFCAPGQGSIGVHEITVDAQGANKPLSKSLSCQLSLPGQIVHKALSVIH